MKKTNDFLELLKLIGDKGDVFLKPKEGSGWPTCSTETRLWRPKDPNEQYETNDGEVVLFVIYESYKGDLEEYKDKITFEEYQNRKSVTLTSNVVYYSRTLQAVCVSKIDKMYTYIREDGSVKLEEDTYPFYNHKILIFNVRKEIQGEYGDA